MIAERIFITELLKCHAELGSARLVIPAEAGI